MDITYKPALAPVAPDVALPAQVDAPAPPMNEAAPAGENTPPPQTPAETLAQTLLSYGYKASEKNMEMLRAMLDAGIPLTKENVGKMNQAVKLTGTPQKALFLLQNNMRMTETNAAQLEGFASGQTKISAQINNLLAAINELQDPELAARLKQIVAGKNAANAQAQNHPVSDTNRMKMNSAQPQPVSADAANAQTAKIPQAAQPQQAAPQAQPQTAQPQAQTAQTHIPAQQAQPQAPQQATPPQVVPPQTPQQTATAQAPQTQPAQAAQPQATPLPYPPQQAAPKTPAQPAQTHTPSAPAPQAQQSPEQLPAQKNTQAPAVSAEVAAQTRNLAQVPLQTQPAQTPPQTPQNLLFPLEQSTPQAIDKYMQELREILREVQTALAGRETPDAARVTREARTLEAHIDFTRQISNQTYVQLPLFHNGQQTQTALHVYKDAKKSGGAGKGDSASALIALDTAALGHFETYVQKKSHGINCQFRLETDEIAAAVRDNIHKLSDLLREKGYSLDGFSFLPPGEPYTLLTGPKAITGPTEPGEISHFDQRV